MSNMIRSALVSLAYRGIASGVRLPDAPMVQAFKQWSRLIDLTRRLDINVFLDVGANRGFFSKHLRMSGYRGRLLSFEPIPQDHDQIRALAANDAGWTTCCYALGSENGTRDFHLNFFGDQQTVLSSFLKFKDERLIQFNTARTVKVEIRRLDDILPQLIVGIKSPRIFLKMDTQGYDGQVIEGATECLEHVVGMQSEISVIPIYQGMQHYTESLAHYERLGFALADLFVVSRQNGFVVEYDCIMARPNELRQH
jgi:FkbM family methyltransferase